MLRSLDDDEIPLALVARRSGRARAAVRRLDWRDALDEEPLRPTRTAEVRALEVRDRLRPSTAGALAGLFAGAGAVYAVHALEPAATTRAAAAVMARVELEPLVALVVVHALGAVMGAAAGASFAVVTRHLRRFVPLLFWALVFFPSLTLLAQVAATLYAPSLTLRLETWLGASAVFAFLCAFELPLRRRA
jgi:hypothetical protein